MNNSQYPVQYRSIVNPQPTRYIYDPQLAAMENYNHAYAITKTFVKNCNEQTDWNNLQNAIYELEQYTMSPLSLNNTEGNTVNWQHPLLQNFKETIAWFVNETSLSLDMGVTGLLSAMLMASCGKVRIHVRDSWQENAALYILGIGRSGTKKSTFIKRLKTPFEEFEMNNANNISADVKQIFYHEQKLSNKQRIREILKNGSLSKSDMLLRLKELSQEQQHFEKALCSRSLFISAATAAGFIKALSDSQGSTNILDPEPRFLQNFAKESSILELLLSAFSDERYSYETAYAAYSFESLCINMCIMCQPDEAQKFLDTKQLADRGLLARFIPIYNNQTVIYKFDCSNWSGFTEGYKNKIQTLLKYFYLNEQKVIFKVSDEAQSILSTYQLTPSFQNTDVYNSFIAKGKGLIVRIAAAIHLWNFQGDDDSFEISLTEIQLASDIVNTYIMPSVDFMYGRYNRKVYKMAHKILQRIYEISPDDRNKLYNGIAISDLKKMLGKKGTELDVPLELLSIHNFVRVLKTQNGADKIIVHRRFYYEFPQLASQFTILD